MTVAKPETYQLVLRFTWGGGVIWPSCDLTRAEFGVGAIEEILPISAATKAELAEMTVWHDTALNWEYPPDPGPWRAEEYVKFDKAANELLIKVQLELGDQFNIIYRRLGSPE